MLAPKIVITHRIDPAKLTGIKARADDLRPVWLHTVQPILTEFLLKRFETEGAYLGTRWAPLAPATVELRKRPGHGRGGIGRDIGRLWASFVKSAGSTAAPNGILKITETSIERGSSLRYAQWFARGYNSKTKPVQYTDKSGNRKWTFVRRAVPKAIPARPIIPDPMPAELVSQVEAALTAYVAGGDL